MVGKALADGHVIDATFSRPFCKQLLGQPLEFADLRDADEELHKVRAATSYAIISVNIKTNMLTAALLDFCFC